MGFAEEAVGVTELTQTVSTNRHGTALETTVSRPLYHGTTNPSMGGLETIVCVPDLHLESWPKRDRNPTEGTIDRPINGPTRSASPPSWDPLPLSEDRQQTTRCPDRAGMSSHLDLPLTEETACTLSSPFLSLVSCLSSRNVLIHYAVRKLVVHSVPNWTTWYNPYCSVTLKRYLTDNIVKS